MTASKSRFATSPPNFHEVSDYPLSPQVYNQSMTVCIAAIADEGKSLIIAADQMATMPHLVAENEGNHKIFELSNNIYLLAAGSGFNAHKVYNNAKGSSVRASTVGDWVLKIQTAYKQIKLYTAENMFLAPRGLQDFQDYLNRHGSLNNQVVALIDSQLMSGDHFQEHFIVTGVDPSGNASVYIIQPPGEFGQINDFVAIGSGQSHASNSLYARGYSINMTEKEATYLVFEAKRRAEKAPGVGKATDMIVVSKSGKAKNLTEAEIDKLDTLYNEVMKGEKDLLTKKLSK